MAEWLKAPEADMQLAQMRQELIAQPAGSNPATSTNITDTPKWSDEIEISGTQKRHGEAAAHRWCRAQLTKRRTDTAFTPKQIHSRTRGNAR